MGPICPRLCSPRWKWGALWTTDPMIGLNLISTLVNLEIMLIELYKFLTYLMIHPKLHQITACVLTNILSCTPTDYEKLRPYFGWANTDVVKQTLNQTTQWGVAVDSFPMKRYLKSRNPAVFLGDMSL